MLRIFYMIYYIHKIPIISYEVSGNTNCIDVQHSFKQIMKKKVITQKNLMTYQLSKTHEKVQL